MYLPDDPSAVAGAYIDGMPGAAHGTAIRADHMNAITNEIANVVTGVGITLDKSNSSQMLAAITEIGTVAATRVAFRNLKASSSPAAIGRVVAMCESPDGRILAVGGANYVALSSDGGATWNKQATSTPTFSGNWQCCTFGGAGTFVIAGTAGEIQTSTNGGITWSNSPGAGSGYTGNFFAATFSDSATDLFALYGSSGEIQTSVTGGGTYVRRKTGGAGFIAAVAGPTWAMGLDLDGKIWRADPATPAVWTQVLASTLAPSTLTQMQWYDDAGVQQTRICYKTAGTTYYLSDDLGLTWTAYEDTSGTNIYAIYAAPNGTWLGIGGIEDGDIFFYTHAFDLRKGDWALICDWTALCNAVNAPVSALFVYITQAPAKPNQLLVADALDNDGTNGLWSSLYAPG